MKKLKWRKCRNVRFGGYSACGIYDFYYIFANDEPGNYRRFDITAQIDAKFKCTGYKLYDVHQRPYKAATSTQLLGEFKTSIEAKRYAESLI